MVGCLRCAGGFRNAHSRGTDAHLYSLPSLHLLEHVVVWSRIASHQHQTSIKSTLGHAGASRRSPAVFTSSGSSMRKVVEPIAGGIPIDAIREDGSRRSYEESSRCASAWTGGLLAATDTLTLGGSESVCCVHCSAPPVSRRLPKWCLSLGAQEVVRPLWWRVQASTERASQLAVR